VIEPGHRGRRVWLIDRPFGYSLGREQNPGSQRDLDVLGEQVSFAESRLIGLEDERDSRERISASCLVRLKLMLSLAEMQTAGGR